MADPEHEGNEFAGNGPELNLMDTVAAVGRIGYSDLLTIAWASVLFTICSIPLVTVGGAIIALVRTMTVVVTGENRGGPTTERERIRIFLDTFRANVRRGLPYSAALVLTAGTTIYYVIAATQYGSGVLMIGGLIGLYAIVIVLAWSFRAASVTVRSAEEPGFAAAAREGAYLALEYPSYTVLHLVTLGGLLLVATVFPIAYAIVVPGLIALIEVVSFEETGGQGAMSLVRAYRGELA